MNPTTDQMQTRCASRRDLIGTWLVGPHVELG